MITFACCRSLALTWLLVLMLLQWLVMHMHFCAVCTCCRAFFLAFAG